MDLFIFYCASIQWIVQISPKYSVGVWVHDVKYLTAVYKETMTSQKMSRVRMCGRATCVHYLVAAEITATSQSCTVECGLCTCWKFKCLVLWLEGLQNVPVLSTFCSVNFIFEGLYILHCVSSHILLYYVEVVILQCCLPFLQKINRYTVQ